MYNSTTKQSTYTVAGVAYHDLLGKLKLRFGKDHTRVIKLTKMGFTNVIMCELDNESTKLEAVLAIKDMTEFSDPAIQALIKDFLTKHNK